MVKKDYRDLDQSTLIKDFTNEIIHSSERFSIYCCSLTNSLKEEREISLVFILYFFAGKARPSSCNKTNMKLPKTNSKNFVV